MNDDNLGFINAESLENYITKQIDSDRYTLLFKELIDNAWFSSPILLLFFLILKVFSGLLNNESDKIKTIIILLVLTCILIGVIVFFFIEAGKNTLIALQNQIENKIRNDCKECVRIKENSDLNAYNIVTYHQLLQIEASVCGKNAAVYCYSTYRDDGKGAGLPPAEKIIEENLKRGVKYYDIFYQDSPPENPQKEEPERNGEMYVDLSKNHKNFNEFLDFEIYRHMRFDIMIYRFGDGQRIDKHNRSNDTIAQEDIEGYFGLNFPVKWKEEDCATCPDNESCPSDFNRVQYEKTFYKKMPDSIARVLYNRLKTEVDTEQRRRDALKKKKRIFDWIIKK